VNNRDIPDICLQHVMAIALLDKTVTFTSVHDNARLTDPRTLQARAKIRLIPDEELQNLMPLRAAIVDVTLVDGTHLSRRIDDVRGTASNPMTRAEIVAKASDLIAPILGPVKCASLIERVFQLDTVRGIHDLRPLLQTGD
jgi:2-methylcitrate dehydratase PrpD